MRLIIIGAGRGSRLRALTDSQPKCYTPIAGRRILDWILEASIRAGLEDAVFVGGYQIDQVRRDYPSLTFSHNTDWKRNNILASLFCAEKHMEGGFVCAYSDILFRSSIIRSALEHPGHIVLCADSRWRERYARRACHPEADAEKIQLAGDRVTNIARAISSEAADAEYIGVARFDAKGARLLREAYHRVQCAHTGRPWRDAPVFEKAYLIPLFQEMVEQGVPIHCVLTTGNYMEIDTEEDYEQANRAWSRKSP